MNKLCRFLPEAPKGGEGNDRELGGAAAGPIPQRPGGRPAPRPGGAPQPPAGGLRDPPLLPPGAEQSDGHPDSRAPLLFVAS